MMSVLELRHLKSLLALAETGSVSQAAQRVCLTQSALSHQLKQLETAYGLTLFERKTQPLRFTPAGERLLRLARELPAQVAAAERDLARIRQGEAGEVRVAVECHTCFDWLMPAMDRFRSNWPAVELDIVSGFHADPVGLLLSDRADLAIVSEAEPQAGIVHLPLFSYEMVGIAAREHPLAAKAVWRAEDFAAETLIHYPVADEMLDLLRKLLLPAGINPARRTAELTIAIIQLVASRRGVAVLPYWAVQPYLERGYVAASQVGEDKLRSELYAALRADDAERAYMQDFVQTVRDSSFATLPGLSPLAGA
ncbi:LysR family transcriptional regulator [Chromobacterium violaceum]|uniref:LysR family transcriptional regulator n=1 Tax=Chromobacterium violaceum TaxID=536 RepID=UPI0009D992DF|nr:LysR family transcriptional regulator [Chromobacterium violaceum]OQS50029.1 LysR family transcriptional regulator [Chromobacterium violaceum]OQS52380.1 LysR family transcriptional regulator [Chromobacterium violaceum]QRO32841.1 LysR family transcriptional regulator [Chromobacterium violaceum]QRQ17358.1 LysR family transcriptional regulator [Chromobacterium violaceum]